MSKFTLVPFRVPPHFSDAMMHFPELSALFDDHLGMGFTEDDMVAPSWYRDHYLRPRRLLKQNTLTDEEKDPDSNFQVMLDVNHFTPEEISVKTVDNVLTIQGKHEEKMDEHGFISREFTRRYVLAEDIEAQRISSSLSKDGVLTVMAPKKSAIEGPQERKIPINLTKAPALMRQRLAQENKTKL